MFYLRYIGVEVMTFIQSIGYPNLIYTNQNYYQESPYERRVNGYGGFNDNNNGEAYAKTALSAGLLQVLASSLNKMSRWLGNRLVNGKEFASAENVQRVSNDMVKNNKLDVTVEYITPENADRLSLKYGIALDDVAAGKNAFFSAERKLAVAPKSKPSLLPHELGHAINAKSKFWSFMQKSRRFAPIVPLSVLLLSKFGHKNENGKPNFVERNAGILGFSAFLPTIMEEGKASLRGIKQAEKTLANEIKLGKVNLRVLKRNYLTAWLTYLLAGIGLGIATKYSIVENKLSGKN